MADEPLARMAGAPLPCEPAELGELTHDAIAGHFRIWQRRRGHRYSLDDVLTAWVAAQAKPDAARVLELGSGVGSVLLMLCHKLPQAHFLAVEAQRNSFALLERNVADNVLGERVALLHGDLRHVLQRAQHGEFDLITGTPPYVPPERATASPDSQRQFARQELRGGVEDYVIAAARLLARAGRVVVCADARAPERVERAAHSAGLAIEGRLDALPRAHKAPLFSVFTLSAANQREGSYAPRTFVARSSDGARTDAYHALREFFGIARPERELPSP
jgi:tRNA1Val (adenine37-N6)-methyltransferase